ncbi:hypothetical protein HMPREF0262_01985 [Clostridium sp. ATCC 29733]|nr:hypothetical protein HMPREF0262_01985 [Clostridium sp. ATCC 29733]
MGGEQPQFSHLTVLVGSDWRFFPRRREMRERLGHFCPRRSLLQSYTKPRRLY